MLHKEIVINPAIPRDEIKFLQCKYDHEIDGDILLCRCCNTKILIAKADSDHTYYTPVNARIIDPWRVKCGDCGKEYYLPNLDSEGLKKYVLCKI